MDAHSTIFHEPAPANGPIEVFAYGATWARWMAEDDQRALVLVANAGPITEKTTITIVRGHSGPLAFLSSPEWEGAICVQADPEVDIPKELKEIDVCLFQETDRDESYNKTLVDMESRLQQEMRNALGDMEKSSLEAYVQKEYPEYLDTLLAMNELNHADARVVGDPETIPDFITIPVNQ